MKWLIRLGVLMLVGVLLAAGAIAAAVWHYGRDLPDYAQLQDYRTPIMTRVHAADGRLLAEYAIERRIFVPIGAIPKSVIDAFLSAEDKSFYDHFGLDLLGILRASFQNVENMGSNRRPVGASTITQQVAKNFLLTNEVSIARKVREAILAVKIEQVLSKDRILELYLNEIYLGYGSYGVAAAALNYFNRSLDELTVSEAAFLATLPKAPNNYDPARHPDRAKQRRDWVVDRMFDDRVLNEAQARAARAEPIQIRRRDTEETVRADYFAEEVRRELAQRFGETALYKGGLSVRTTLDPRLQAAAEKALADGLITYDRRHGWRGPIQRDLKVGGDWRREVNAVAWPPARPGWSSAVVLKVEGDHAEVGLRDGSRARLPMSELTWARRTEADQKLGPQVRRPADVLAVGDAIFVEPVELAPDRRTRYPAGTVGLRQIPDVAGGLVALDPHTGRVLAMSGGWSFEQSQFNRATQAQRQPGSAFKPFVYLAALEKGFTPSTVALDAPFVIDQGPGQPKWKPGNYSERFFGLVPLRSALEQSLNLVTVRIADAVGMDNVSDMVRRLGAIDKLPQFIAMALGSGETTVMRMTVAYAQMVNGGRRITPTLIDRIQDRDGVTIFRHDQRPCERCREESPTAATPPRPPDGREQVLDPAVAYQMVSMLQGAVERGTGSAARAVGKPVAGKTGTTNDYTDAWFVGFSPDLAVGVYIGFDTPRTLGNRETGGGNAAPIFRDFMAQALADKPATPFRTPPGVRLVRVNAQTGALAGPGDGRVIVEAFRAGTEPRPDRPNGVVPAGFGTLVQPVPQAGEAEQSVGGSPGGLY